MEREIEGGLDRSAAIAYEARPRDLRDEKAERHIHKKARIGRTPTGRQSVHSEGSMEPVWGKISHPGWSSPSSPDLPNLHFEPVILELSHLIEAKAVSLAPADPLYEAGEGVEQPVPDPVAVALLQRPASMGLRDYMAHLAELGMIEPITQSHGFLDLYERARFSGEELDETDFRALMNAFAEILRNLQPLATDIIDDLRATAEDEPRCSEKGDAEGDRESIQTSDTVQRTPQVGTCSSTSSSSLMSRNGSHDSVYTAPSRPGAGRNTSGTSRFTKTSDRQPSLSARGRMRSSTSSSGYSARSKAGSVIRLAEASGPLDLPYTFTTSSEE